MKAREHLPALAGLQRDVLRAVGPRMARVTGDDYAEHLLAAEKLAADRGFTVLNGGSTRLGIAVGRRAVAKVAYDYRGLANNVQEAAAWLAFPDEIRKHLAPCLALAPELVLVQRRVKMIGPPLTETFRRDTRTKAERAARRYRGDIGRCMAGMGFKFDSAVLRLDNFGTLGDRVAAIDYADKWRPIPAAWGWVLTRLSVGPLELDSTLGRDEFYDAIEAGQCLGEWPFLEAGSASLIDLCRRARAMPPRAKCLCHRKQCPGCGFHAPASRYLLGRPPLIDQEPAVWVEQAARLGRLRPAPNPESDIAKAMMRLAGIKTASPTRPLRPGAVLAALAGGH